MTCIISPALRVAASLAAAITLVLGMAAQAAAMEIREVRSPGGITAWLVEDYTVPIVTMRFAFRGGSTQDPAGREGLANMMTGLFDEGAGSMESEAFQTRLDDIGLEMSFNAGRDAVYGSARMLADVRQQGFTLLELALTKPRFDAAPIDRIRGQIVAGIDANAHNPETAAQIAWTEALYGDHPYARRDEGTAQTLAAIGAEDLRDFHRKVFARDNLTVGVVGAISADELARTLDQLFGDLPENAELRHVQHVEPKFGQSVTIEYDLPQTSIRLAYPGIERNDPAFFAAFLMNHVLGGGTFLSRLFEEVRERRGLAYSVGSSLVNNQFSSALAIATATRSDRAAETLGIIREVVRHMAEEGPTQAELDAAKRYVKGAYAVANLTSSGAIARTLVDLQLDKLGIDYIDRREALIDAVTLDEAKAAARRLLSAEPAVMILGPAGG